MPIFDQGYQHWDGPLAGHAWRWYTITRHGVRAQLKNRFVVLLLVLAWAPALALAAALATWGLLEQQAESVLAFLSALLPAEVVASPADYRGAVWTIAYSFFFKAELVVVLLLVLLVGPNLISRDLRFNALPLYLARPVRRLDYFVGKMGVIAFFIAAVVLVPAVLAYVLGVSLSLDLTVIRDTHHVLWGSLAYGAVITVCAGTLMLALSSLSRRSVYVALAWVALWVISFMVSGILGGVHYDSVRREVSEAPMREWLQENKPPEGFRVIRGRYVVFEVRRREMGDEQKAWLERYSRARQAARARAEAEYLKTRPTDWRPLCSFAHNLDRMGDLFLDTDDAWVTFGRALQAPRAMFGGPRRGPNDREADARFLADQMVYQYPWVWSAGILAGLVGISLWTLSSRVKSLDRLK